MTSPATFLADPDVSDDWTGEEPTSLRARLAVLVEGCPLGIFFDDADDRCVFVNTTFCRMMEITAQDALGDGWARTVHPDDLPRLQQERSLAVAQALPLFRAEYRYVCPSGRQGWIEEQTRPVHGVGGELLGYVGTVSDITDRKQAEAMQVRQNEILEERVRERTAELLAQTERLAEMNAALKVLLRQRDEDRQELEQVVLANVRRRVGPLLDRLEAVCAGTSAKATTAEIRQGLAELTSPFTYRLSQACQALTPAEFQVAELIRQGLATKEIAVRLGVGAATIDSHRHHIRRKLGLGGRRANLRAYLLSLEPS